MCVNIEQEAARPWCAPTPVRTEHGQAWRAGKGKRDIVHLRGGAVALVIGNDLTALLLPNANTRVCGTEVNAHCRSVYLLVRHRVQACL